MSECKDCRFYLSQHTKADNGACMNFANAEVKWVGGGGEYSSSENCYCPRRVDESQGCELFDAGTFTRTKIRDTSPEQRERGWAEEQERNRKAMEAMQNDPTTSILYGRHPWARL